MIPQEQFIVQELELTSLSPAEQHEITEKIRTHMQEVLIETTITNLSDDQRERLEREVAKDQFDEDTVMRIALGVPHLQEKIQSALDAEWNTIKKAYDTIK